MFAADKECCFQLAVIESSSTLLNGSGNIALTRSDGSLSLGYLSDIFDLLYSEDTDNEPS